MNKHIVLGLVGLIVFLTSSSTMSQAQVLGSMVGTVTDPSGAAIASAKIRATQTGTSFSRETATNADGYFVISFLSPALYTVVTEASGFSSSQAGGYFAWGPDPQFEREDASGHDEPGG
jgi:carboxypeptidase family protein